MNKLRKEEAYIISYDFLSKIDYKANCRIPTRQILISDKIYN